MIIKKKKTQKLNGEVKIIPRIPNLLKNPVNGGKPAHEHNSTTNIKATPGDFCHKRSKSVK